MIKKASYDDVNVFHNKHTYPVQNYCKHLLSHGIVGELWIYQNGRVGDGDPDVKYPSIKQAAESSNTRYLQKDYHY